MNKALIEVIRKIFAPDKAEKIIAMMSSAGKAGGGLSKAAGKGGEILGDIIEAYPKSSAAASAAGGTALGAALFGGDDDEDEDDDKRLPPYMRGAY